MPNVLASLGQAGRIVFDGGDQPPIHIDVITRISQPRDVPSTSAPIENGASIIRHRRRKREPLVIEALWSDVEPVFLAQISRRWERDHADKSRKRINAAQLADVGLRVWDGQRYRRTPATELWQLDKVEPIEEGTERGVYRATLTFSEFNLFQTQFTTSVPNASSSLGDDIGPGSQGGLQSTTDAGELGPTIEAGAWP